MQGHVTSSTCNARLATAAMVSADHTVVDPVDPPLRQCQKDCLEACAKGARKIEMACGTGKTLVMKELVSNVSGRVSRLLFC